MTIKERLRIDWAYTDPLNQMKKGVYNFSDYCWSEYKKRLDKNSLSFSEWLLSEWVNPNQQ